MIGALAWLSAMILAGCARADFVLKPWNGVDEWNATGETKCDWLDVKWRGHRYRQCVRPYYDWVSNFMKKEQGVWRDCVPLLHLWHKSHQFGSDLFVDVGANIGACTMLIASANNNISTIAFEPNPHNLFYFTRSLTMNPSINRRVELYPYGLGERLARFPIYMEMGNAGNSVLGPLVLKKHRSRAAGVAEAAPLDAAFILNERRVRVMKMDVQGFEVNVLRGSHHLLSSRRVGCFKFEADRNLLAAVNTSVAELFGTFERYGYVLLSLEKTQMKFRSMRHRNNGSTAMIQRALHAPESDCDYYACTAELTSHLLAVRAPTTAPPTRHARRLSGGDN